MPFPVSPCGSIDMTCLVAYDIEDNRTRNRIAKYLLTMGVRLQKSVFIIEIERHAYGRLSRKLYGMAKNKGQVAIVRLCAGCRKNAVQMNDETPFFYVF